MPDKRRFGRQSRGAEQQESVMTEDAPSLHLSKSSFKRGSLSPPASPLWASFPRWKPAALYYQQLPGWSRSPVQPLSLFCCPCWVPLPLQLQQHLPLSCSFLYYKLIKPFLYFPITVLVSRSQTAPILSFTRS